MQTAAGLVTVLDEATARRTCWQAGNRRRSNGQPRMGNQMLEVGSPRTQRQIVGLATFEVCLNLVGALNNRRRWWWRARWATVMLAGAGALTTTVPACLLHQDLTACLSDKDCKLDRICDAGRCVWPPARPKVARMAPNLAPAGAPLPAAPTVIVPEVAGAPGGIMFRFGPEHRGRS